VKTIYPLLIIAFIFAECSPKVDPQRGQLLVEGLLTDLKNENYSSLDRYYTSLFNESEPNEKKIAKFQQLKQTLGSIQSWKLISSKENYNSDKGINELELKYNVKCDRMTVQETYLVINDEGELKIIFQNIENLRTIN
jgi:hypothetical protein